MTCIVGIVEKGKVYIGGDSAGCSEWDITIRKDSKVFKIGDFVFGCTSSFRMIQLIRYSFKPPKRNKNEDIFKYICTKFVTSLRKLFKDNGFSKINSNEESGGTFLVGYAGRLFRIEDDFQVGESIDNFNACGCGMYYAKGALYTMNEKDNVKYRITNALVAAAYFSGAVRPPYVIESV